MSIQYRIIREQKLAYIKCWGMVTTEEILLEGTKLFSDEDWENGFNLLLDYREVTETDLCSQGIMKIVIQDKQNEFLFDKSKCAVIADKDILYGLSRMWELLSIENKGEKMVFRDVNDALSWLGLSSEFLDQIESQP